jgi:hypothetical protein
MSIMGQPRRIHSVFPITRGCAVILMTSSGLSSWTLPCGSRAVEDTIITGCALFAQSWLPTSPQLGRLGISCRLLLPDGLRNNTINSITWRSRHIIEPFAHPTIDTSALSLGMRQDVVSHTVRH